MEFIYTNDKTLASVLISQGRKPISSLNGQFVFAKDKETLEICQKNFDSSKYRITNTVFC